MPEQFDDALHKAFAHHQAGRLTEAQVFYAEVLAVMPAHSQALLMMGVIALDLGNHDAAAGYFQRQLDQQPDDPMALLNLGRIYRTRGNDREAARLFRLAASAKPDLAPIFNDLGVSLNRLGARDDALAQLDRAVALDPAYGVAHFNRGMVLHDLQRFGEAAMAQLEALRHSNPANTAERTQILINLSQSSVEAGDLIAAERACRAILAGEPDHVDASDQLAKVLDAQGREAEALDIRNDLARKTGLERAGKTDGAEATVLVVQAVGASHIPTRYMFDPERLAIWTLNLLSPDQPDAPFGSVDRDLLGRCDLVLNTLGEVEKGAGQFDAVATVCAELRKPVLNPVPSVMRTGRDQAEVLYGGIPGLVVPKVRRIDRDGLARMDVGPPCLVRPNGVHGGKDLALLVGPGDRDDYLARMDDEDFLLTDFVDFKSADGQYRKYRFIFVDRRPYAYHLAVGDHWLMHYWRAEMGRSDAKKAEEERFLSDWPSVFGPMGAGAVEAVARIMDLDYGGMDCGVLPGGEVVFFEANACMLMHLDDPAAEFPYKHQWVPLIRDRVTDMVLRMAQKG